MRFVNQTPASSALSAAQCLGANEYVKYYLNGDLNQDGNPDLGKVQYFTDNYRYYGDENTYRLALHTVNSASRKGTDVRYYVPEDGVFQLYHNNVAKSLMDTHGWFRASSVFPLNQWVRALSSQPFLISAPKNAQNAKFQVAYQIRHAVFRGYKSSGISQYIAMPVSNGSDASDIKTSNFWWLKSDVGNGD